MRRVAGNACCCYGEPLFQQAFTMDTFGVVFEYVILMDFSLFLDGRSFAVAAAAEKRNIGWTNRGFRIIQCYDIVASVA